MYFVFYASCVCEFIVEKQLFLKTIQIIVKYNHTLPSFNTVIKKLIHFKNWQQIKCHIFVMMFQQDDPYNTIQQENWAEKMHIRLTSFVSNKFKIQKLSKFQILTKKFPYYI